MDNDFYGTGFLAMFIVGAFLIFVGWGEQIFILKVGGFLLAFVGLFFLVLCIMEEYTSYYTPPAASSYYYYEKELVKWGFFFTVLFFVGGLFVAFAATRWWMPHVGVGFSYFGVWLFKETLKDLRRSVLAG